MPEEYSTEQTWKLYEKLPSDLKEAIFSENTAEDIFDICVRHQIDDERISEIARYTGHVLLGILPPAELQKVLEKKLNLNKEVAQKIFREINRYVFYPVKTSLAELYKIEITPSGTEALPEKKVSAAPKTKPAGKAPAEKEEKPEAADVYRETSE